ncbi:hypothetical protein PR048_003174 [Dryococelus australis]|uniref:Uncharacterized protein n=1 Tax=Dryococelus australis TaxID=614101 RepID=A0ABQ9IMD3_9NEOP|nr:hypothetical protein PR048_003174 [Dryococelus australis]
MTELAHCAPLVCSIPRCSVDAAVHRGDCLAVLMVVSVKVTDSSVIGIVKGFILERENSVRSSGCVASDLKTLSHHTLLDCINRLQWMPVNIQEEEKISAYPRLKAKLKYRNRIRLERASQKQSSDTHKTPYDRVKRCREHKINIKASERVNVDVFTQNKQPCPQQCQTQFFLSSRAQLFAVSPLHTRKYCVASNGGVTILHPIQRGSKYKHRQQRILSPFWRLSPIQDTKCAFYKCHKGYTGNSLIAHYLTGGIATPGAVAESYSKPEALLLIGVNLITFNGLRLSTRITKYGLSTCSHVTKLPVCKQAAGSDVTGAGNLTRPPIGRLDTTTAS